MADMSTVVDGQEEEFEQIKSKERSREGCEVKDRYEFGLYVRLKQNSYTNTSSPNFSEHYNCFMFTAAVSICPV